MSHAVTASASTLKTIALTAAAMFAFAANSLLCRLALQQGGIDPASFSSIRLVSGAVVLFAIVRFKSGPPAPRHANGLAALMLFAYVAFFSFAYVTLSAGTGALILFGTVQLTMLVAGLQCGERFGLVASLGLALAIAGLIYLLSPGVAAPPLQGALLMAAAGIAWGVYSLRGRKVADPLAATAGNFMRAAPLALVLNLLFSAKAHGDVSGVVLAVASGALTSGVGYVIWYAALPRLSAMRAATVQLSVPLIAAFGGVAVLSEALTPRLVVASMAILGGIAVVLMAKASVSSGRHAGR
jgi:drug/metabolite transporter (DMT)-like permease